MRFSAAAVTASAVLFASSFGTVAANDQCTCPPAAVNNNNWDGGNTNTNNWDGGNSVNTNTNNNNNWSDGGSDNNNNNWYQPPPVKRVPKVKATKKNLQKGAKDAIKQLQDKKILPSTIGKDLQDAIEKAIEKHTQPKVIAQVEASGSMTTVTVTPTATVVPTTIVGVNGSVSTVYMTQTITALPPGATILSNETLAALDSIEAAINDAIAAVNLSKTGLDASAQAELQKCLTAVLDNGGLPAGYSCISQTGSTSAGLKTTFNNILEQFLGILPAKLIDGIQDAVMPMLTDLLPDEATLLNNINAAISSVIASASGTSVTALSMMQSCYSMAIMQNGNSSYLQCYMAEGGPFDALQNGMSSLLEQFTGVLPGELLDSVRNLTASTLQAGANGDLATIGTNLTDQLDNALTSVGSSLSGNAVTLYKELQACANDFLRNGNQSAITNCVSQAPAASARTMVNSVAEQYSGYIPSAFFSDLVSVIDSMESTGKFDKTQIITALDAAFNTPSIGPAYVGCFHQIQACILNEINASGDYKSTCPGPQAGCELIGSTNSSSLANTTLSSEMAASSLAAATSTIDAASGDNSTATAEVEDVQTLSSEPTSTISVEEAESSASSVESTSSQESEEEEEAAAATAPLAGLHNAAETAPAAVESLVSSTPISSADPPASTEESSASSSSAPAESSSSSSEAAAAEEPTPSVAQRFAKKSKTMKRSHQKLRLMYSDHYARV